MSVQTAVEQFKFELPSLSYIDVKWEEPNLRVPAEAKLPTRQTGSAGWLARWITAYRTWRRNSQAAAELAIMSDQELMDIGISRSDMSRLFERGLNEDLRQRGSLA